MLPDVSEEVIYDQDTVDELLRREKDGRPLLMRLFEIYLQETPRLLEELESALEERDSEATYEVLHQMKGSAAALGARRLFRTAEATLPLCEDGRILLVPNLVERIETESDTFIQNIASILNGGRD